MQYLRKLNIKTVVNSNTEYSAITEKYSLILVNLVLNMRLIKSGNTVIFRNINSNVATITKTRETTP